jgi:16S rRNA (guanine527-N7)-methyltransferase
LTGPTVVDDHRGAVAPTDLEAVLADARALGLLGPGPVAPQLDHARAFVRALAADVRALDLGSGGGLPGLVILAERPDVAGVLLDATQRRCDFLRDACERLGFGDRARVVCARAEDAAREPEWRGAFDVVTARSFGAPAVTAECAVGFLRDGGSVLVSEPPEPDPNRWPADGLARLGLVLEPVPEAAPSQLVRLRSLGAVDARWPRRVGIPRKRPLW